MWRRTASIASCALPAFAGPVISVMDKPPILAHAPDGAAGTILRCMSDGRNGIKFTGEDGKWIFVDRGHGYLEPRQVETGKRTGDRIEVRKGLEPGERIVTSGTFLIDSESQLKAAASGMAGMPGMPGMSGSEDSKSSSPKAPPREQHRTHPSDPSLPNRPGREHQHD